MKAGRELDALIAEKVMGLKIEWEHYAAGSKPMVIDGGNRMAPRYSTQIADTKLVWEKMIDNGYCFEMVYDMVAWSVCFVHIDRNERYYADWKNSLEAQVCLAALEAVKL